MCLETAFFLYLIELYLHRFASFILFYNRTNHSKLNKVLKKNKMKEGKDSERGVRTKYKYKW